MFFTPKDGHCQWAMTSVSVRALKTPTKAKEAELRSILARLEASGEALQGVVHANRKSLLLTKLELLLPEEQKERHEVLERLYLRFAYLDSILFLFILSPFLISWKRIIPAWDDTFFLHNSVCVSRSFWEASLTGLDQCFSQIAKSPIMALLLIPAGPFYSDLESLCVAPFVLSLITGAFVLLLHSALRRGRVPFAARMIAAIAAITTTPLRTNGAPFLVDGLLAIVVACTVAMVFEENEEVSITTRDAVGSSAHWALVITVGMLSKTTYAVVVLFLVPIAIWISFRRSGARITYIKLAISGILLLPVSAIFLRYGRLYLAHAEASAFGPLSAFYNNGLSPFKFILNSSIENWPIWFGIAILLGFATFKGLVFERAFISLSTVFVIAIYFLIASTSPNKDPRFFWMVWLSLPFCVAGMIRPSDTNVNQRHAPTILLFLCLLIISIPSVARLDLRTFRASIETLHELPENTSQTVMLMSDSAHFNIETLLLAQQLDWEKRSKMRIGTVAYDIVSGGTPEKSLKKLESADFVVGQFPLDNSAPEWTNTNVPIFQQAMSSSRRVVRAIGSDPSIMIFSK